MTIHTIKTVKDLIDLYSKIPDENWCSGIFSDGNGSYCAVGHYNIATRGKAVVLGTMTTFPFEEWTLVEANDGDRDFAALGATPKERVLAFLAKYLPEQAQ